MVLRREPRCLTEQALNVDEGRVELAIVVAWG